jgi:uncharacterized protein YfiM (DUF2279 family)
MKLFHILATLALTLASSAHADEWTGRDKNLHFVGGAAIGSAVTLATDKPIYGIAAGAAVGLAKEIYDSQNRDKHTPSTKDLLVTVLGAAVGSYTTHIIIRKNFVGFQTNF